MQLQFGTYSIAGCPPFAGVLLDDRVLAVHALKPICARLDLPLTGASSLLTLLEDWERNLSSIRSALPHADLGAAAQITSLRVDAPIPNPRQVVCMGANYRKHVIDLIVAQGAGSATVGMSVEQRQQAAAALMDERARSGIPYAWLKAASAVAGPFDVLTLPGYTQQADWELELALVIGKPAHRVSRDKALEHVAGYMIANDVTARDHVYRPDIKAIGTDWLTAKGAPGFLPTGPHLVPRDSISDPHDLRIVLKLNGKVMQDESTRDMIFGIERQIEYISAHIALSPGDIICTGSPAGNGAHFGRYLQPGDVMEGSITGLGVQRVRCASDDRQATN